MVGRCCLGYGGKSWFLGKYVGNGRYFCIAYFLNKVSVSVNIPLSVTRHSLSGDVRTYVFQ